MAGSPSPNSARNRLLIFGLVLFVWVGAVSARLVQLQVVNYGDWMQRAQRQQQRTFEVSPRRGIIYDRNGHELAMSVMVESIFAVPNEIPDQATTATLLSGVTGQDPQIILARLQGARNFCWIARKVEQETAQRVRALNLRGVYFQKEPKRFYPKGELAAQVLGYVGLDDEGLGGIERGYDENLKGIPGKVMLNVDARRVKLGRAEQRPEPGENIVLTIDEKIQYIVEKEIDQAIQDTKAEAATIVVQNPHTGEILALANRPTFNPNNFNRVPQQALKNRAVSDVYEPGSMFKTVTVSAALEEKVTNPDERFDVSQGYILVGGARMRDAHRMGVLTVSDVLAHSSNVGAIKIGMRLGEERMYRYIRSFGFGQATGIELPGETRGLVKPVKNWSKTSIGAMSMGQEIGVTPIQAISALSTIANDGVYTPPRIVMGTTPPGQVQRVSFNRPEQRRIVSTMTAAQMKKMMESVVLFGTARRAILDGYSAAGKTGTAQKVDPKTGRYGSKYVASFIGFAPVNNPAVTIAVIIDSAQGLHQGGQVSAPVFARVAQQVLAYLNVPHDVEPKNPIIMAAKKVKDQELDEEAPDHLGALEIPPDSLVDVPPLPTVTQESTPNAKEIRTLPVTTSAQPNAVPVPVGAQAPQMQLRPAGLVMDVDGGVLVPSFTGKTLRGAIVAAQDAGVELDARGTGIARAQYPPSGTRVNRGTKISVQFVR